MDDFRRLANRLHLDAMLEGSVRHAGNTVYVSAKLVTIRDLAQFWGATYEFTGADPRAAELAILRDLADHLGLRDIRSDLVSELNRHSRPNTKVRNLYLQGRFFWNKRTEEDLKKAVASFQAAISEDPSYAPAYAGLADTYGVLQNWGERRAETTCALSHAAALKAVELDSGLAEAHSTLGHEKAVCEYDWSAADRELRRAIELDPTLAVARLFYAGEVLTPAGHLNQALSELEQARNLDPLAPNILVMRAAILGWQGRWAESIELCRQALEIEPRSASAYEVMIKSFLGQEKYDEAVLIANEATVVIPNRTLLLGWKAYALARSGRQSDARKLISRLSELAERRYVPAYSFAVTWLGLENKRKALEYLTKAIAEHSFYATQMGVDSLYSELRADPDFARSITAIGLKFH